MTGYTDTQNGMVLHADNGSLRPEVHRQLEITIERYRIPDEEMKANEDALSNELARDEKKHQKALEEAVTTYQQKTSLLSRFWYRFNKSHLGGRYVPDVPKQASPETELFQSLVDMQEAVGRGYELLSNLPKVVKQMSKDYVDLERREENLITQIRRTKEVLEDTPRQIELYRGARDKLLNYDVLGDDEKQELHGTLASGKEKIPSLARVGAREIYIAGIDNCLAELEKTSLGSDSTLQLAEDDLSLMHQQRELLEHEAKELIEGWRPALEALHKLKVRYDKLSRFAPAARLLIGMNNLRTETVTLIADSERRIENAVNAIYASRVEAEITEEAANEAGLLKVAGEST